MNINIPYTYNPHLRDHRSPSTARCTLPRPSWRWAAGAAAAAATAAVTACWRRSTRPPSSRLPPLWRHRLRPIFILRHVIPRRGVESVNRHDRPAGTLPCACPLVDFTSTYALYHDRLLMKKISLVARRMAGRKILSRLYRFARRRRMRECVGAFWR